MTLNGWLQILVFFLIILAITKPLGLFMVHVFNRERTFLDPVLRPVERLIYRLTGVNEEREMRWTEYAVTMLLFSAVSMLVLYLIQRLQGYLPFNPQNLPGVDASASSTGAFVGSAFNTAASFTTNTNWQSYVPEVTMSYLTQMAGLAYHNFVSAAVGIALAIAFIRGIARRERDYRQFLGRYDAGRSLGLPAILPGRCSSTGRRRCAAEPAAIRHGQAARPSNS
jgi:potassium-transporting ATPase potassium-binding subunit